MKYCFAAILVLLFISFAPAFGHPMLADSDANSRWHIPDNSSTATFLGGDQKETAVIVLKKAAVLGTVLTIKSDSTGIVLQSGDSPRMFFAVPTAVAEGSTSTVKLAGGDQPVVFFNDKEQPRFAGKAIQVALAKDETLTLSMQNATFATVKFEMAGADGDSDTTTPAASGNTSATDKLPPVDIIPHVEQSVFQIQILNIQKQPFAGGSGFIVSDDGFAVTNFHVIQGGVAAQAILDVKSKPVPLELWSVDPEHDLALVRLPRLKEGSKYESLTINNHEPAEGDKVTAVGFSQAGYVVTSGSSTGTKDFQSFPEPLQKSLDSISHNSRWVQTDCVLNENTSGGPLIDSRGQVVGVSSWIWLDDKNLDFALSSKYVPLLLKHRSDTAITFAGAAQQFQNIRTPWSALPRPSISQELLQPSTPTQLTASSDAFISGIHRPCSRCQGTGKYNIQIQTGTAQQGIFSVATYRTDSHICERCKGTGIERANDEVLVQLASVFLKRLSSVVQSDPHTQAAVSKCYQMVTDNMIGDHKTWQTLTSASRSIFSQRAPMPGSAVIAKVWVTQSLPMDNGQRRYMAQVAGTDQLVFVIDPVMADALEPGMRVTHQHEVVTVTNGPAGRKESVTVSADEHYHEAIALMGGIIDGPGMLTQDKRVVTVVKDGFLIAPPVQNDWWWWFRDRQ